MAARETKGATNQMFPGPLHVLNAQENSTPSCGRVPGNTVFKDSKVHLGFGYSNFLNTGSPLEHVPCT